MKNIKIGLTAVVAVAAMSFSVVIKGGLLGKDSVSDGCYETVTVDQIPPNPPITYTSSWSPINPCMGNPKPQTCNIDVPTRNSPVSSASLAVANYKTTGCPAPYNNFCCFEVINNTINTIYYRI